MKRFYLSLCLVIVAVTTVSASSKMMAPTDSLELIGSGTGSGGGRTSIINDLYVNVVNLFGNVFLVVTVRSDLGRMDFEVTNLNTGEFLEGEFNAQSGSYPIPISNSPGHYRSVFTLNDGRRYEKEFIL